MSSTPLAAAQQVRQNLERGQKNIADAFAAKPNAKKYLHGRTQLVDQALSALWQNLAPPKNLALVAVGGYGRCELFPASDIDLLILLPDECTEATSAAITPFITLLWDIGIHAAHAVRDIDDCLREAQRDITIQTALLEARFICGDATLFSHFQQQFSAHIDAEVFFKAKQLEQQERHMRLGDTPFSLEPNCKESPGGLRDIHIIRWAARSAGFNDAWPALAKRLQLSPEEARQLALTEKFCQLLRIRLHLIAQRHEDRVLFDYQEALAAASGITARAGRRASEILMQRYYRNAKRITQLNLLVLQNFAAHISRTPKLPPIRISSQFQMVRELLDIVDPNLFEQHPTAILEAFLIMQRRPELKGMTARTLRALWHARGQINAAYRQNPIHRQNFLALFRQERGLTHALRRMNQYDILGELLPDFGRIVGRMQHDLFHIYTVDQHILQVLRNLRRLSLPEFADEYPLCSRLMADFDRRWLLYLAALFHDIAKGRGGDHSVLGATLARRFCAQYDINTADTELLCFWVAEHLSMSAVAQKQDLAEPEVIQQFAQLVGDEQRLIGLYLLTVCDIRGTSPKVWNVWKGKLLEELYLATRALLSGKGQHSTSGLARRQDEARRLLRLHGLRDGVEAPLWGELGTVYFLRHDADEIAWHTRHLYYRVDEALPIVKARLHPVGGLQVMVWVADQKFLFARLCSFFTRYGYNIVDAKIHTTRGGKALDSFVLLDSSSAQLPYRDMIGFIEHDLTQQLQEQPALTAPASARIPRQVRHFPIQPEIIIRPDERAQKFIMSITAIDRPGLLYAIARVLGEHNVQLHTAKISTLGERIEDTFLISGDELTRPSTMVRLEQDLLKVLQV